MDNDVLTASSYVPFFRKNDLTGLDNSCKIYLLRWGVATRLIGLDSRQDGKRFPGCLEGIARPSLDYAMVFFVVMDEQHRFRIPLAILIVCICFGNLAILPVTSAAGMSMLQVSEFDFDQAELEEDFFIAILLAVTMATMICQKLWTMELGFQPACLSPLSPPPRHS